APPQLESKLDLSGVSAEMLLQALREALARAASEDEGVQIVQPRHVTIEGQISRLRSILGTEGRVSFRDILSSKADRVELAVTLLATLELIKRREATAHQSHLFGPIEIRANLEAQAEPAAEQPLPQVDR
ncbi:MAG TPA: hypothetical protein VE553_02980, partial [Candidatus Binatia bacterium]|nr:hypothetical protein [Candidatus Binatia bacterium]